MSRSRATFDPVGPESAHRLPSRRAGAAVAALTAVALGVMGTAVPAAAASTTVGQPASALGRPTAQVSAPGAPGENASWTTGAKQGVGTAASVESKTWYTLSEGTLAEVYYPRVDVANSRSLELIVTDNKTFADRESTDTTHRIQLVDPRALVYR